jgi:hypothetical protein
VNLLGAALRRHGLTARALAAWAGTTRVSALPRLMSALPRADTPAGAVLELFVAGQEIALARLRALDVDALCRAELVEVAGDAARARVAVLPVGESLLVCDRLDAAADRALVCWPDDSSYHLALALPPGPHARWIDLGTGSAFAPLLRPAIAGDICATDLNARAVAYARAGAALSGLAHVRVHESDLGEGLPGAQLVSCNAPIPTADPHEPMWRSGAADFVARLCARARGLALPGGSVVVHAALDALAPVIADLPGERVVVAYTPPGVRAFAVAWWSPEAPPRLAVTNRALTAERPHVTYADYRGT